MSTFLKSCLLASSILLSSSAILATESAEHADVTPSEHAAMPAHDNTAVAPAEKTQDTHKAKKNKKAKKAKKAKKDKKADAVKPITEDAHHDHKAGEEHKEAPSLETKTN